MSEDELDPKYLDPKTNPLILTGDSKSPLPEESDEQRSERRQKDQQDWEAEEDLVDPEKNPFIDSDTARGHEAKDGLSPMVNLDQTEEEKARAEAAEEVERKIIEVFGEVDAALLGKISLARRSDKHFQIGDGRALSELSERELGDIDAQLDRKAQG